MNDAITEAKRRLPLPALLHRLGLREHAKKSARCPFHDDKHNSFSVWKNGAGFWFWKCHTGCDEGDEITFLERHRNISRNEAIKLYLEVAGANGVTPPPRKAGSTSISKSTSSLDWQACVEAFTDGDIQWLAKWRGYSIELCRWLKENGLVGLHDGCIAFPVHDRAGNVVAVHYRAKNGKVWFYHPKGTKTHPLVIGELAPDDTGHGFESYWDAFAFMDKSGERHGIVITRGASNGALVADVILQGAKVYLWTQNDPAGEKWVKDICVITKAAVICVKIPAQYKDINAWTCAGATDRDLLDAMVEAAKAVEIEAQKHAAKLAPILDSICAFLRRYIVFQVEEQTQAIALWIVHCWVLDAFDYTPYLHIRSPEKQCGKTRLLDCLMLFVPKVWLAILPSEAVLFRKIEKDRPTLLLDEVDGIFSGNGKDEKREALRSLLNAGFERGAQVPRCVGQGTNQEVRNFAVFCPKALAGIGGLPDTIQDRSIPIELVRRARDEKVEKFRKREAQREAAVIRAELEAWAKQPSIIERLREARPNLPDALSDRQQDICEPLLAIADMAGGDWRERARRALITLCSESDENESLGVKLLSDIRQVFDGHTSDKIASQDLLKALIELETDAPWANWWEADLKNDKTRGPAAKLARLLKPFGIRSRGIRLADSSTPRGYLRQDFEEAWKRYCPPKAALECNNATAS